MSSTNPRLQAQDLYLTCPETDIRGMVPHSIPSVTPSAMSTTTFTEANVTAAMAGLKVRVEDGDARGQWREIISVSSTTATLDGTFKSVTGVTKLSLWRNPAVPFRVTTADASSTYDVISTDHASLAGEPDSFWSRYKYQMLKRGGANSGKARLIGGFTSSTGNASDSAADATTIGDLFEARKMIRPEAFVEASTKQRTVQRMSIGHGRHNADAAVPVTTEGTLPGVRFAIRPIVTAGASGVVAGIPDEIGDILEDVFDRSSDTGGTVVTANSTTVDLTAAVLTAGGFGLLNTGELIQFYSTASSGQDVASYGTGQLAHASVTVGSVFYASTHFRRKFTGQRNRTFDLYRGGKVKQSFHGCAPSSVKINITRDQVITIDVEYTSSDPLPPYDLDRPISLSASAPLSIADTGVPVDGRGSLVCINGTRIHIKDLSVDFGISAVMRQSIVGANQYDGCAFNTMPVTGTMTVLADMTEVSGFTGPSDLLGAGKFVQFLYQKGRVAGKTFGIGIPAMQITECEYGNADGMGEYRVTFVACEPELSGNYPVATYPGLQEIYVGWV